MTLDEYIEYFRYSTAIGFSFAESQQIANYLEELKELREKYKNVSEAYMKAQRYDSKNYTNFSHGGAYFSPEELREFNGGIY